MKNRENPRAAKFIYSHIVSEIDIEQSRNGYKVFAVSNCNHDAGAFAVAEELAIRFADMGKKTLMINGDVYGPEKTPLDSDDAKKGFSDFLAEDILIKDILSGPYRERFFYISRGSQRGSQKEQLLCSPKVKTLLAAFYDKCDIIFCVTPSLSAPVSGKLLCKLADAVILVAAMGQTKKEQLEAAKKQMDGLEIPISGIIATQSGKTAWEQYINRFDRNHRE